MTSTASSFVEIDALGGSSTPDEEYVLQLNQPAPAAAEEASPPHGSPEPGAQKVDEWLAVAEAAMASGEGAPFEPLRLQRGAPKAVASAPAQTRLAPLLLLLLLAVVAAAVAAQLVWYSPSPLPAAPPPACTPFPEEVAAAHEAHVHVVEAALSSTVDRVAQLLSRWEGVLNSSISAASSRNNATRDAGQVQTAIAVTVTAAAVAVVAAVLLATSRCKPSNARAAAEEPAPSTPPRSVAGEPSTPTATGAASAARGRTPRASPVVKAVQTQTPIPPLRPGEGGSTMSADGRRCSARLSLTPRKLAEA